MHIPEQHAPLLKAETEYAGLVAFRHYLRAAQDFLGLSDAEAQERYAAIVIERHRLEKEISDGISLLRRN